MTELRLAALYHYPIKSCRGIALQRAQLTRFGLERDRHWMIVDAEGRFLSQRELPSLALIEPEIIADRLRLRASGMPDLLIPDRGSKTIEVDVWGDRVLADDTGREAATWMSDFLGVACRLVALGPAFERTVDPAFDRFGSRVAFSDGYPLLLLSEASLADLNTRMADPLPMNRFRPNLVVTGCAPYAEDDWRELEIGDVRLHVVKPCARCAITTVDQDQGQFAGKEPLRTLARYRRGEKGKVLFGQNVIHESKTGVLNVGDAVKVIA